MLSFGARRHLLIPLVNAERAWAYAMELKNSGDDPRKRHHLARSSVRSATTGCMFLKYRCHARITRGRAWGLQLLVSLSRQRSFRSRGFRRQPSGRHSWQRFAPRSRTLVPPSKLRAIAPGWRAGPSDSSPASSAHHGSSSHVLTLPFHNRLQSGTVLLEKETDWGAALAKFLRAKAAFEQLEKARWSSSLSSPLQVVDPRVFALPTMRTDRSTQRDAWWPCLGSNQLFIRMPRSFTSRWGPWSRAPCAGSAWASSSRASATATTRGAARPPQTSRQRSLRAALALTCSR